MQFTTGNTQMLKMPSLAFGDSTSNDCASLCTRPSPPLRPSPPPGSRWGEHHGESLVATVEAHGQATSTSWERPRRRRRWSSIVRVFGAPRSALLCGWRWVAKVGQEMEVLSKAFWRHRRSARIAQGSEKVIQWSYESKQFTYIKGYQGVRYQINIVYNIYI